MNDIQTYSGSPKRIDIFLAQTLDKSRNFFQHLIERGVILVNNKTIKKSYKLEEGDQYQILELQRFLDGTILSEATYIDCKILLETQDYAVIIKPQGVLSHPKNLRDFSTPSVTAFLYHKYKQIPSIANFIRSGIVHRLDKDTYGLMIIVKSERGLAHFKSLFERKSKGEHNSEETTQGSTLSLRKYYTALCDLTLQGKQYINLISFPHAIQSKISPKLPHTKSKLGISILEECISEGETVRIKLQLITGRTHQARIHLSQIHLPIVGDYLYGLPKYKTSTKKLKLCAYKLEFIDPDGKQQKVELTENEINTFFSL